MEEKTVIMPLTQAPFAKLSGIYHRTLRKTMGIFKGYFGAAPMKHGPKQGTKTGNGLKKLYGFLGGIVVIVLGINIYLLNTYEEASRRLSIDPQFSLTDMNGNPVSLEDYRGQRLLIGFGYTNCIDVCPVTLATLTNILYEIEDTYPNAQYQYKGLFITVDPERDTPEVLRYNIKDVFHDSVVGLWGTPQQVRRAADSFSVDYEKYGEIEGGYYSMIHSVYIFVVDEAGDYQTYFAHTTPPKTALNILQKYYKSF